MKQKLVKLGLAIVMALGLVNCSNDRDDAPAPKYQLSADGKTLVKWNDDATTSLNMKQYDNGKLNGVEKIESGAFEGKNITSIVFSDSLRVINAYAFKDKQLTSVVFPSKLESIGEEAFRNNSLTSVDFPTTIKFIGRHAFMNNQITKLILPEGFEKLGTYVFAYNNISNVELPSTLTEIYSGALTSNPIRVLTVKATTPPYISGNVIDNRADMIVYVPASSIDLYRTYSGWNSLAYGNRMRAIQ